jgi:hypothetical protein
LQIVKYLLSLFFFFVTTLPLIFSFISTFGFGFSFRYFANFTFSCGSLQVQDEITFSFYTFICYLLYVCSYFYFYLLLRMCSFYILKLALAPLIDFLFPFMYRHIIIDNPTKKFLFTFPPIFFLLLFFFGVSFSSNFFFITVFKILPLSFLKLHFSS